MKVDPEFKRLVVPLSDKERSLLDASIEKEGCRVALDVWKEEDTLLDGHNRLEICEAKGREYRINYVSLPDRTAAKIWILENQAGRRNLNKSQSAILALDLEEQYAVRAKERQAAAGGDRKSAEYQESVKARGPEAISQKRASDEAAEVYGVGGRQVRRAKVVKIHAVPELLNEVKAGNVTVRAAENISKLNPEVQKAMVSRGPNTIKQVSTVINDLASAEKTMPGITEKAVSKIMSSEATTPKEAVEKATTAAELQKLREFNDRATPRAEAAGKRVAEILTGKCELPNVRELWCDDCGWGFDTYVPEPSGVSCPYCGGNNLSKRDKLWLPKK